MARKDPCPVCVSPKDYRSLRCNRCRYASQRATPLAAYFWRHVEKAEGCWRWTGAITKRQGYGYFRGRPAHRFAYQNLVGPIPAGLTLDHLCRNRACVNPAHLEPVTVGENVLRGRGPTSRWARAQKGLAA